MNYANYIAGPYRIASSIKDGKRHVSIRTVQRAEIDPTHELATINQHCPNYQDNAALLIAAPDMYEMLVLVAKSLPQQPGGAEVIEQLLARARGEV